MNLGPPQSSIKLHKKNTIELLNNVTITVCYYWCNQCNDFK